MTAAVTPLWLKLHCDQRNRKDGGYAKPSPMNPVARRSAPTWWDPLFLWWLPNLFVRPLRDSNPSIRRHRLNLHSLAHCKMPKNNGPVLLLSCNWPRLPKVKVYLFFLHVSIYSTEFLFPTNFRNFLNSFITIISLLNCSLFMEDVVSLNVYFLNYRLKSKKKRRRRRRRRKKKFFNFRWSTILFVPEYIHLSPILY